MSRAAVGMSNTVTKQVNNNHLTQTAQQPASHGSLMQTTMTACGLIRVNVILCVSFVTDCSHVQCVTLLYIPTHASLHVSIVSHSMAMSRWRQGMNEYCSHISIRHQKPALVRSLMCARHPNLIHQLLLTFLQTIDAALMFFVSSFWDLAMLCATFSFSSYNLASKFPLFIHCFFYYFSHSTSFSTNS